MKRVTFGLWAALAVVGLALVLPAPAAASGYTQTRHPVVLVHGLFGFDALFGAYDYWYGIAPALRSGGARVYAVNVSAAHSSTQRGEQLVRQLDTLRALYGHSKFNLIGHSHGGPTIRYAASVRPDLVASVTSVGAPQHGSKVADVVRGTLPPGSLQESLSIGFFNAFGYVIGALSGSFNAQNAGAALDALTSSGAATFNNRHPQGRPSGQCRYDGARSVNGIRYYSFTGSQALTNVFDPSDALMAAGSLFFGGVANDGLVARCSADWGWVLRDDYPWNHLDEVNQVFGIRGLFTPDPVAVYRSHVNRLKNAGL
jgi:triacylglycerol lipase